MPKCQISRNFFEIAIFRQYVGFSTSLRYKNILKDFFFVVMTCSRIWLNLLVDDCHLDSITKLEIKTLGDSLEKKTLKNKCGYSLV